MENYLKYMAAFFGTIAVIIVIMLVYFTCWSISKRRRERQDENVHRVEYKTPPFQRRYDNDVRVFKTNCKWPNFRPTFPKPKNPNQWYLEALRLGMHHQICASEDKRIRMHNHLNTSPDYLVLILASSGLNEIYALTHIWGAVF
jgi:hypothetical protein